MTMFAWYKVEDSQNYLVDITDEEKFDIITDGYWNIASYLQGFHDGGGEFDVIFHEITEEEWEKIKK